MIFIGPAVEFLFYILAIMICRFLFFQWKERKGSHLYYTKKSAKLTLYTKA